MTTSYLKKWLHCAGVRAIKTVAQAAIAAIGSAAYLGQVNLPLVLSTAILSGILSLLTSIAGLPELKGENQHENLS